MQRGIVCMDEPIIVIKLELIEFRQHLFHGFFIGRPRCIIVCSPGRYGIRGRFFTGRNGSISRLAIRRSRLLCKCLGERVHRKLAIVSRHHRRLHVRLGHVDPNPFLHVGFRLAEFIDGRSLILLGFGNIHLTHVGRFVWFGIVENIDGFGLCLDFFLHGFPS